MNLKRITLFLTAFSIVFISSTNSSSDRFNKLKKSTLTVVLPGVPEIDNELKKAFKDHWTFSKYQFVELDQTEALMRNPDNFFLFSPILNIKKHPTRSKIGVFNLESYQLYNGGNKFDHLYNVATLPDLMDKYRMIWHGVSEGAYDEKTVQLTLQDLIKKSYHVPYAIQYVNDQCQYLSANEPKKYENSYERINKNAFLVKGKTLIINRDAVTAVRNESIFEEAHFKKSYSLKYKFVSDAQYKEIAQSNDSSMCLLWPIGQQDVKVYDVATKKMLYSQTFRLPGFLNEKNVERFYDEVSKSQQ